MLQTFCRRLTLAGGFLAVRLMGAETNRVELTLNGHSFSLPTAFTLQLAAESSMVSRPVSGSIDQRGRLFVTESSGSTESPSEQIKHPSHRILRLEDTDHDGHYDKSVVFAEHVMFPQGCLFYKGSVYVAAPPSIWKFTDTDGDGVADQSEEWWKGGTLTGCANDVHGPYVGPDGYLYWTKGAFAEQTHERAGRKAIHDRAAHIYRAKPDGSELEVIMSGGMDNPVEIAFNRDGEAFFTSTFIDFSQPGSRDGMAHAIYGGVYGKANSVLEDGLVQRSSPDLLPVMTPFGPGAACGLCTHYSRFWGREYVGNLFATTFNLHKVTRHQLQPTGASYRTVDEDFLTSPDVDFHPTDVLEDGDGSLLVLDTGGWYKLCCPSSQLVKPDVLGAIYRIRREGVPGGRQATGQAPFLQDTPYSRMKMAGIQRSTNAIPAMRKVLEAFTIEAKAEEVALARVAIEGLGRMADAPSIPLILRAADRSTDPFFAHSVSFALIEINSPEPTSAGLAAESPAIRRAALMALDQMETPSLRPEQVAPLLESADIGLRNAAQWILGHHGDWGSPMIGWFRERLADKNLSAENRVSLEGQLGLFHRAEAGQIFLGQLAGDASYPTTTRAAALEAIAAVSTDHPPERWTSTVAAILSKPGDALVKPAISAASRLSRQPPIQEALHRLGSDGQLPEDIRLQALQALPAGTELHPDAVRFLRTQMASSQPAATRSVAADTLSRSKLSAEDLQGLASALRETGPMESGKLLNAFDGGGDEVLGRQLLDAIRHSAVLRALPPGQIRAHFAKFPEPIRTESETFLNSIHQDSAQQAAKLDILMADLNKLSPDLNRGQALFNGPKAACSTCHKIGYLGGDIGPELTKIGEVRTERDLLESIVYPSASFVRSYEPTLVRLRDGDTLHGLVRNESAQEIEVVTGPGPTRKVARADISQLEPGTVSIMPAGLADALSRQDLADILVFVKTVRWR